MTFEGIYFALEIKNSRFLLDFALFYHNFAIIATA